MRLLLATATTCLLLPLACGAVVNRDQLRPVDALKEAKRVARGLHKEHGTGAGAGPKRSMKQQQDLSAYSSDEACEGTAFIEAAAAVDAACVTTSSSITYVDFPLFADFVGADDASSTWTAWCDSGCAAAYQTNIVENPDIADCFHYVFRFSAELSVTGCSNTGYSGETCGLVYSMADRYANCENYYDGAAGDEDALGLDYCSTAADECETYQDSITGATLCRVSNELETLESLCYGACLGYMVDGYAKAFGPGHAATIGWGLIFGEGCLVSPSGDLCMPLIKELVNANPDGPEDETAFDAICETQEMAGCMTGALGLALGAVEYHGRTSFVECAVDESNVTASVDASCVDVTLQLWLSLSRLLSGAYDMMCISESDGTSCATKIDTLSTSAGDCISTLGDAVERGTTCAAEDTTCDATFEAAVAAAGCCAGNSQEAMAWAQTMLASDYPHVVGYTPSATFAEPTAKSGTDVTLESHEEEAQYSGEDDDLALWFATTCGDASAAALPSLLRKRCAWDSTTGVSRTLQLLVNWDYMTGSSAPTDLDVRFLRALRLDIAYALGLAYNHVVLGTPESASYTVTTLDETTGSGLQVTVTVTAQTSLQRSAAVARFDQMHKSGQWYLPNTLFTMQNECGGACVDAESHGVLLIKTTSGALATSVLVAVAVTAAMAVLW